MAKDPDDRFPSTGDLGRAALAAGGPPVAPTPERLVAIGEAAPGDRQETVVSPDQAPTVLAADAPAQRRLWPWALAAVPIAGLALIAALALGGGGNDGGGGGATTAKSTATTTTTQPQNVAIKTAVIGGRPNNIVLANGKAWVVRSGNPRLAVIDAKTVKRQSYSPHVGNPSGEAAGFGKLWVINQDAPSLVPIGLKSHRQEGKAVPLAPQGVAVAVAAATQLHVGRRPRQPRAAPADRPQEPGRAGQDRRAGRRPAEHRRRRRRVWVIARRANTVTRMDIASGAQRPIFVGEKPFGIAYGRGAVWVTNNGDDTVTRIDSGSLNTLTIPVGRGPKGIAVGAGAVWVANSIASTITRIDPQASEPAGDPIARRPQPATASTRVGDDVWVTSPSDGKVQRLTP